MIVEGLGKSIAVELTRPNDTTAYTAGDVVSNSTSATTLMEFQNFFRPSPSSGPISGAYIVEARLTTNKKSISPRFRLHFYNSSNPTISADNAAHKELYADIAKRLGFVDLQSMTTASDATNSDMSRSVDSSLRKYVQPASGSTSLFVGLETLDGFTPDALQKFTLVLTADQN